MIKNKATFSKYDSPFKFEQWSHLIENQVYRINKSLCLKCSQRLKHLPKFRYIPFPESQKKNCLNR